MASKENIAAVMAHGDADAKISLLKRAVVSVTKQKQGLEQHNRQLQDQMAAIGEELDLAREEIKKLQKKLKTVEGELEAERKRGHFGASVKTTLRGISSFVTGTDGETVGSGAKRPKTTVTYVNLSPEDQEKILAENENMHIQLFDLRAKQDEERRKWKLAIDQHSSKQAALRAEMTELRGLLESKTRDCDYVNVECTRQAALAQFCYHFFVVSWETSKQQWEDYQENQLHPRLRVSVNPLLTTKPEGGPSREIRKELVTDALTGAITFVRTLMSGVSVLLASLRDLFDPHLKAATLTDIRCYRDRLSTLLEAHNARKASVLHHVKELEDAFAAPMTPKERLMQVQRAQGLLLSNFNAWLFLICQHIRLLVDACVRAENSGVSDETNNTQGLVESATQEAIGVFAAICGCLDALGQIFADSGAVVRQETCDSTEWLFALERFWWEGCGASASLQRAALSFQTLLGNIAVRITDNEPVRAALQFLRNSLDVFAESGRSVMKDNSSFLVTEVPHSPSSADVLVMDAERPASADEKELVAALAAADRAAVFYHTQMNCALLELAEKQEELDNAQQEVTRVTSLSQQQAEDAGRVREALETQIRFLSERLVEFTPSESSGGINNL